MSGTPEFAHDAPHPTPVEVADRMLELCQRRDRASVAHVSSLRMVIHAQAAELAAATARAETAEARRDAYWAALERYDGQAWDEVLADRDQARAELEQLWARIAELGDEWGVQVEDSSGAVIADDEAAARRDAVRYSRYHLPGGEPSAYYVVRRLVTPWRPADVTAAPDAQGPTAPGDGLSATESGDGAAEAPIPELECERPTAERSGPCDATRVEPNDERGYRHYCGETWPEHHRRHICGDCGHNWPCDEAGQDATKEVER